VVTAAVLLDTLPVPSTDEVDRMYHQLKDILSVATKQQTESSLQWWAEVSVLSLGHSKASRQRTMMELSVAGTTSSPGAFCGWDYIFTAVGPNPSQAGPTERTP
jgi:hypothetical protein